MSRVRADQYTNNAGTGSPLFPNGLRVTGVSTFTGNVSVGGTLTYEDVTNVDSVGIITAQSDVVIADKIIHLGDTDTAIRFPAADTFAVETGGSEALRVTSTGLFGVGTNNPQLKFVVSNNNALGFEVDPSQSSGTVCGVNAYDRNASAFKPLRLNAEEHRFDTSSTERLRITSRGGFQFSNGFMSETVKINTTARTGTQAVNLDDGMVHYFSTNSAGTWKPNFTMSAGDDINATIATGDVFSPTMIVAKGATTHYATTIQVDGSDVTPEYSGGAPSDGGGSGTFDVYAYTIIKTGDDTFKAFGSVSTYE